QARRHSSIPLTCSLCPKNPNFSDESHLLTHISSKTHLANRFKLEIRSKSEREAKTILDGYDVWYEDNKLDTLLSDRLAHKNKKSKIKDEFNRIIRGQGVKKNTGTITKEGTPVEKESTMERTPVYRAPVPRMHLFAAAADVIRASTPVKDDWALGGIFDTPTGAGRVLPRARIGNRPDDTLDPRLATPYMTKDEEDEEDEDAKSADSATKLKGILWPGMNLFDSATPEMKRKRNQKKERYVMDQMMAISEEIEPAEVSYFANGDFRGSRDIFGPLSSCETSPVRKTRKSAMTDLSVNALHLRSRKGEKFSSNLDPEKKMTASRAGPTKKLTAPGVPGTIMHDPALFVKPLQTLNPLSAFGNQFVPTAEENEEFRLTLGNMKQKPSSFGIYQDEAQDSPGRTESPLEDHGYEQAETELDEGLLLTLMRGFDFPNPGLPNMSNNLMNPSLVSPTPGPKVSSMRLYGKENGRPELPILPSRRNASSAPSLYQSPFTDTTLNPLYDHAYARTFDYGEQGIAYHDDGKASVYVSNFTGDFRQLNSTTKTTQSHLQTGMDHGSSSGNGSGTATRSISEMEYGM
ncbi:hypothetical protein BJ875DRAFT_516810, partial [Amylocarpus encephaloides]